MHMCCNTLPPPSVAGGTTMDLKALLSPVVQNKLAPYTISGNTPSSAQQSSLLQPQTSVFATAPKQRACYSPKAASMLQPQSSFLATAPKQRPCYSPKERCSYQHQVSTNCKANLLAKMVMQHHLPLHLRATCNVQPVSDP